MFVTSGLRQTLINVLNEKKKLIIVANEPKSGFSNPGVTTKVLTTVTKSKQPILRSSFYEIISTSLLRLNLSCDRSIAAKVSHLQQLQICLIFYNQYNFLITHKFVKDSLDATVQMQTLCAYSKMHILKRKLKSSPNILG